MNFLCSVLCLNKYIPSTAPAPPPTADKRSRVDSGILHFFFFALILSAAYKIKVMILMAIPQARKGVGYFSMKRPMQVTYTFLLLFTHLKWSFLSLLSRKESQSDIFKAIPSGV